MVRIKKQITLKEKIFGPPINCFNCFSFNCFSKGENLNTFFFFFKQMKFSTLNLFLEKESFN